ncbi:hypothetical protein [Streptomyces griseosporeus]|uniref:hypothetical protein n=1 Tax=Streptomyces griseosporeus TaxID=1910 RepID=UPI00167CF139|nr:hypothetical protein [Streptomyces griseosporeus]GHF92012.1 hypothetical protein GCM10018783_73540 [Streptomyces griseosporeus]
MAEGTGRELTPVKFGIKPGEQLDPSPTTKPDKFGQVYNAEKDAASGNVPSAAESNRSHSQSDVDSGPRSQHHTLGTGRNQASPGNHIHDGVSSPKLGPLQMDASGNLTVPALVLTGAKGGNVALTNLINMLKNFINFTDNTT